MVGNARAKNPNKQVGEKVASKEHDCANSVIEEKKQRTQK
jgi:hypothetical protein